MKSDNIEKENINTIKKNMKNKKIKIVEIETFAVAKFHQMNFFFSRMIWAKRFYFI